MTVIVRPWDGRPIGKPGIISGMPIDTYHSAKACVEPSISSSGLRRIFTASPRHYWANSPYNPKRVDDSETDALILGRAAHHLLFGQDDFKKLFVVRPATLGGEKWNGNRSACRIWLEDRAKEGRCVITEGQLEQVRGMAESLFEEPLVKAGILNGSIETSWFCKHQKTGIWLKARPDASPNDSLDFADLKTTASVEWDDIQRSIFKFGYYVQAGLLAMIVRALHGRDMNSFTLIFIEKSPPFDTAIVSLKESDIARGIRAAEQSIAKFAECLASGKWPGRYSEHADARYLEMREFDQKRIDERLS
jgi:hypothetical protein